MYYFTQHGYQTIFINYYQNFGIIGDFKSPRYSKYKYSLNFGQQDFYFDSLAYLNKIIKDNTLELFILYVDIELLLLIELLVYDIHVVYFHSCIFVKSIYYILNIRSLELIDCKHVLNNIREIIVVIYSDLVKSLFNFLKVYVPIKIIINTVLFL